MLIEVNKQVTETVEMQLPAFFKSKYGTQKIAFTTDEKILVVHSTSISVWVKEDGSYYKTLIVEALSASMCPCTVEEFENTYNETMGSITSAYEANLILQP